MKVKDAVLVALAGIGAFIASIFLYNHFKGSNAQSGKGQVNVTLLHGLANVIMGILPPKFRGWVRIVDKDGNELAAEQYYVPEGQNSTTVTFNDIPYGVHSLIWNEENNGWGGSQALSHSSPVSQALIVLGNFLAIHQPRYAVVQSS